MARIRSGEAILTELPGVSPFKRVLWIAGGIVAPLVCLPIELLTHMCREELFDPLPTFWHSPMILTVPLTTHLGMRALADSSRRRRSLGILLGFAACTTLLYAGPFLIILPLSLMLAFMGIGLLGLAPLVAPLAMLLLAAEFRRRARRLGEPRLPGMWTGFFACILFLALIDLRPALTTQHVQDFAEGRGNLTGINWIQRHADHSTLEEMAMHGTGGTIRPLCMLLAYSRPHVQSALVRENWTLFTGEKELPARVVRHLRVD